MVVSSVEQRAVKTAGNLAVVSVGSWVDWTVLWMAEQRVAMSADRWVDSMAA